MIDRVEVDYQHDHARITFAPIDESVFSSFFFVKVRFSYADGETVFAIDPGIRNARSAPGARDRIEDQLRKCGGVDFCILSHAHSDHYNMLNETVSIHDGIFGRKFPVYMGSLTFEMLKRILEHPVHRKTQGQEFAIPSRFHEIRAKFVPSGHTNDSMMTVLEINDVRLLYTGDFSTIRKRNMLAPFDPVKFANRYGKRIDLVVTEATNASASINTVKPNDAYRLLKDTISECCIERDNILAVYSSFDSLDDAFEIAYSIKAHAGDADAFQQLPVYIIDDPKRGLNFELNKFRNVRNHTIDMGQENATTNSNPYRNKSIFAMRAKKIERLGSGFGHVIVFPSPIFWDPEIESLSDRIIADPGNAVTCLGYHYSSSYVRENFDRISFIDLSNHAPEDGIRQMLGALRPRMAFITHYKNELDPDFAKYLHDNFQNEEMGWSHGINDGTETEFVIREPNSKWIRIPRECHERLKEIAPDGDVARLLRRKIDEKQREVLLHGI